MNWYVEGGIVGVLMVARYCFGVHCFEWYVPAVVTQWLESSVEEL